MTIHDEHALMAHAAGLTRRDALKLAGALGAAAGLGRWAPTGARGTQATPAGERPTLRVAVQELPDALDPHAELLNVRAQVVSAIFDGLLARDYAAGDPPGTGSDLVPALATDWKRVDDLTLELSLRSGATFHDGTAVTAEDVRYAFERVLTDAPEEYAQAAGTLGTETRVEVVDATTVRLVTAAPDPLLEKRLASWAGVVVPRAAAEEAGAEGFGRAPVGAGPYRVVEFRPDEILALEAHDGYWGGPPPAARIEFLPRPEVAARVTALIAGEVDIVTAVPPDQFAAIEAADGVRIASVPATNVRTLYYNTRHPLLGDKRLRQALNLAIDRELIVESLWGGRAVVPRGYQFPDWGALYDPTRPVVPHDAERARALIADAGYDGEPIALRTPAGYYTLGDEVSQAVVEMWRSVGIEAAVELVEVANLWDEPEALTAVAGSNNNEFADPEAFWLRWNAASRIGRTTWTNDRFEVLGETGRRTLNEAARAAAYQEMVDLWEEEAPGTVLYIPTESYGVRDGVAWQPYAFFSMDFRPNNLSFG